MRYLTFHTIQGEKISKIISQNKEVYVFTTLDRVFKKTKAPQAHFDFIEMTPLEISETFKKEYNDGYPKD